MRLLVRHDAKTSERRRIAPQRKTRGVFDARARASGAVPTRTRAKSRSFLWKIRPPAASCRYALRSHLDGAMHRTWERIGTKTARGRDGTHLVVGARYTFVNFRASPDTEGGRTKLVRILTFFSDESREIGRFGMAARREHRSGGGIVHDGRHLDPRRRATSRVPVFGTATIILTPVATPDDTPSHAFLPRGEGGRVLDETARTKSGPPCLI